MERRSQLTARRKARGFSQEGLADSLGVASNTVRRWERGESEPYAEHRKLLAQELDVSLERLDLILRNEDEGDASGPDKMRQLVPEGLSVYLSMEQSAARIEAYEPHFLHGMLQISDYARSLVKESDYASRDDNSQIERLVKIRTNRRQAALTRPDDPVELDLVLAEGALRQHVGAPETMRRQLDHVVKLSALPNVTIRVLAFTSGPHAATYGPLTIWYFANDNDLRVAHVRSYIGGPAYIEFPHEINHLATLYRQLRSRSLSPEESSDLIRQVAIEEHT